MAEFEWMVPDRVLKVVFPVVFDDVVSLQVDAEIVAYLDQASKPIHLIIDMHQVKIHPSIQTFSTWKHLKHPHLGHSVTVGLTRSPVARFLSGILARVMNLRVRDKDTVEEALAYLETVTEKP